MRTSNKLFLGLIFTGLLLIAGLFIFVRVQVARGAVVSRGAAVDREHYWAHVHKIDGPVKLVSIKGLKNILVVPSDSTRVEIGKDAGKHIIWKLDNGVLTLQPDSTNTNIHYHVELFLPNVDSIIAYESDIDVKNTGDTSSAPAYSFLLSHSKVTFRNDDREQSAKPFTRYGLLKFDARDQSEIKLESGLRINGGAVKLKASVFNAADENIRFNESLRLQTDDISVLHLSGQNLRQAIITSTE